MGIIYKNGDTVLIGHELVDYVSDLLENNKFEGVLQVLSSMMLSDVTSLICLLGEERRFMLLANLLPKLSPNLLVTLPAQVSQKALHALESNVLGRMLSYLSPADVLYVYDLLSEKEKEDVFDYLLDETKTVISDRKKYPEDSIGRIMLRDVISVPSSWTVGMVIDYLRSGVTYEKGLHVIFVLDMQQKPIGTIPLKNILFARRSVQLTALIEDAVLPISAYKNVMATALKFKQEDIVSAPVVDEQGYLVGQITLQDLTEVWHDEVATDMMHLGGVAKDFSVYSTTKSIIFQRLLWLSPNLVTGVLASLVVKLFDSTIEEIVAVAVLMPIVTSLGGNAGIQALTAMVRGFATKEIYSGNVHKSFLREGLVGISNGFIFAFGLFFVAYIWFGVFDLGLIIAVSMFITLVFAGIFGVVIPYIFNLLKIDPALASGVFLTGVTDVVGFLSFLGLATLFLL